MMSPHDFTARLVGEVPSTSAKRWGRRPAILFRGSRWSHEALARRVERVRALLSGAGCGRGDRVAIAMENCPEYIVAYFAVTATGAALVPINTFLAVPEISDTLRDARAAILITSPGWLESHPGVLEGNDDLNRIVLRGGREGDGGIQSGGRRVIFMDDEASPASSEPCESSDPAVIIYTSGTTGLPKGVVLTHDNLLGNARGCLEVVGATERDRILVALPLFHSFTQMVGILAPVLTGMSIALCEKLDRTEVRAGLMRLRPTIFPAVPAVFNAMAAVRPGPIARWLNPVRVYISGGAPLPVETLERFERAYRRPLCEGYGLSEASPVVSLNPPRGTRKAGSVGPPLPGVEVRIVDPEGNDVPHDVAGEILVRGPGVMRGYLDRGDETRSVLRDGWLRTGDQGRRDEDGYIFIMGRSKEMLIFRGMNIYPREIESVLESHPAVREAAVIGSPDPARGDVPWAFVTLSGTLEGGEQALRRLCIDRLARYKVPRGIVILDDMPRNTTGKILKKDLQGRVIPREAASPRARAARARQH